MFDLLTSFFSSVVAVFIPSNNTPLSFYFIKDYGSGQVTSQWSMALNSLQISRFLSLSTLIGLCIFLFYQIYKLVHAFVGGFYE